MTENAARDEEPRKASSAPGLEGEGGQYVEGDYGDAGAVGGAEEQPEEGDYPEGNYGDAGTVGPAVVQRPPARLRRTRRRTRRSPRPVS